MQKFLSVGVLIVLATLVSYIVIGCSESDSTEKIDEPVTINLLATSPENGGTVPATGDLRIVFDSGPQSVTVDGTPAVILNNTAFVAITDLPNVIPGTEKSVIIEWKNPDNSVAGAKTITFTVLKPIVDTPQSDDDDADDVPPPNATTVAINPATGATISLNQQFTLTFDQEVAAAAVNGTPAEGLGRNWTVGAALVEGTATLIVEWTNRDGSRGSKAVGPYRVKAPSDEAGPPSATAVFVDPIPGVTIPSDQQFSLTFDQGVVAATVNGGAATGAGRNWRVWPALVEGAAILIVEWTNRDGSTSSKAVGPYRVKDPDTTRPTITSGTVAHGAKKINPAPINAGGFRYDFNEPVTGTIRLTDEAGADLGWIGHVAGQTATLTPVAGWELVNSVTYKIVIDVRDSVGNRTRSTITFVTGIKE